MLKKTLIIVFSILLFTSSAYSQTEQQIKNKLKSQGITTADQIKAELRKRNMTEDDARKLAAKYGISYDEFIASYIIGGTDLNTPPPKKKIVKPVVPKPPANPPKKTVVKSTPSPVKTTPAPINKSGGLPYFGYNLFKNIPSSFQPTEIGPIDPGYIVGPGDVLQLYMWGAVELQYQLTVDIQGNIFIPTAGQFFVSGIAYEDLQKKLINYLSKFYQGLNANPPSVFLDITLAKLRPIRIFVLGEVAQPGGYNISSYATVFNALYSVGGPLTSGSLREIRVIRNNKILTKVDLYDYLLKGKLIGDVRLQNNDMIFIPPRGKTVSIKGEVLRPAIYELKGNENLQKLISYSGNLKVTAYTGRANVERIIPFSERKNKKLDREVIDVELSKLINDPKNNFKLFDNDVVTIFPILNKVTNFVTINGAVYRPGTFELEKVPFISDLVKKAYGTLPDVFLDKADLIRTRPDETQEFITFDLGKALEKDSLNNIKLKPRDEVRIYTIYDFFIFHREISISGNGILKPITMKYADSLYLYDLIVRGGGIKPDTYLDKADIIRTHPDQTKEFISVDLSKVLRKDPKDDLLLKPGDNVKLYSIYDLIDKRSVSISGYVKTAVTLPYADSLTLYDMVFRSGGLKDPVFRGKAFLLRGDVIRLNPDGLTTRIIPFNVQKLWDDPSYNMNLQEADKIHIYKADVEKILDKFVIIEGDVRTPGKFPLNTNMTVMDLILQAGGFTESSLRTEAYVNRLNPKGYTGDKISESHIVKLPDEFDKNSIKSALDDSSRKYFYLQHRDIVVIRKNPAWEPQRTVTLTGEVVKPGTYVLKRKNETLLDILKEAGGPTDEGFLFGANFSRGGKKVVIDLDKIYYDEDERENIFLKNGDAINIPKIPNTVLVTGEVNNPGLYKFLYGESVKDYIDKAGGTTDSSDYIIYQMATGETNKVGFGLFSSNPEVFDGSIINVTKEIPEPKGEPFDLGGTLKDIFAIAASAATVIILATK